VDWETTLNHTSIYPANGLLTLFYFLWSQGPLLLSSLCAAAVLLVYDRQARRTAGDRVRRYGRGRGVHVSYRSHWLTILTAVLWIVASLLSAPPIPLIGALMWLAFVVSLRYVPQACFVPLNVEMAAWLMAAMAEMPHALAVVGHLDPRENARGGGRESPDEPGRKGGGGDVYTQQQAESFLSDRNLNK